MALVTSSAERAIATITLDSPHNRNALSAQLVSELADHLRAAAADDTVRAVVLAHTGPAFCAGADLAGGGDPETGLRALVALLLEIAELPKPVIAVVDGHVRAGGMGLVGACDMAIAGPAASFAFTEARLGLAPSVISLSVLPAMASRAASRYFLTGEVFGPAQAQACGLLTESTPDTAPLLAALLDGVRACSPQGLAASKSLTAAALRHELRTRGEEMVALSARLFGTEDAAEGIMSFLQRRQPAWVT